MRATQSARQRSKTPYPAERIRKPRVGRRTPSPPTTSPSGCTSAATFASMMIAAGVNAKALSTFMGHANISITMDRYGHLMPGSEEEAAKRMDDYLERAAGN